MFGGGKWFESMQQFGRTNYLECGRGMELFKELFVELQERFTETKNGFIETC